MRYGISRIMKRLAADFESAATQRERGAALRRIEYVFRREERGRERKKRLAKRRSHLADILHFVDFEEAEFRDESPAFISDGGKAADEMARRLDGESLGKSYYARRAEEARERLAAFNERLVLVFDLVVKNGSDREESVCELAARDRNGKKEAEARYSRNLEKILKFFLGQ